MSNMATPIKEWSKIELRNIIPFPRVRGENPTERINQLVAVDGNNVMSKSRFLACALYVMLAVKKN